MTQVVTVATDFTDLNQMAQGLVGRVDPARVILPGPEPVDVGEWVNFAVTLQDGTPGFAGVGRCVDAVDNGEDRSSHQRFDVVIDSLQFDTRGQQIFEHILMISGYAEDEQPGYDGEGDDAEAFPTNGQAEPATADMNVEHSASAIEVLEDAFSEVSLQAAERYGEDDNGEATMIVDSHKAVADLADADDEEYPTVPPAIAHDEAITAPPPPAARAAQTNGVSFAYPNGIPFPTTPPRPELAPTQRVTPAPRPSKSIS
jgi:hypothetical protein